MTHWTNRSWLKFQIIRRRIKQRCHIQRIIQDPANLRRNRRHRIMQIRIQFLRQSSELSISQWFFPWLQIQQKRLAQRVMPVLKPLRYRIINQAPISVVSCFAYLGECTHLHLFLIFASLLTLLKLMLALLYLLLICFSINILLMLCHDSFYKNVISLENMSYL